MNILNKIIEYKKEIVEEQKKNSGISLQNLEKFCRELPDVISLADQLKTCAANKKVALIAEIKKASPSKGIIRENFVPVDIALAYKNAGANAISVLTDEKFFQGAEQYLKDIRKVVELPILRKDFIIDPFQIYQTRLMGADIILLIAAALEPAKLKEYYNISTQIGLEVLVEVHDKKEMDFVEDMGASIIGINNRNLETFEVSIENTIKLIKNRNFSNKYIISESGIYTHSDVLYLRKHGVSGVLVGESLMRQENIEKAVLNLMGTRF